LVAAETVGFAFDGDGVVKCGQYVAGKGEAGVVVFRLDVDQQIVLGGGCQTLAQRGEVFQFRRFVGAFQAAPEVAAKSEGQPQVFAGKLALARFKGAKGGQAGSLNGIGAENIGFNKKTGLCGFGDDGGLGGAHVFFPFWFGLCLVRRKRDTSTIRARIIKKLRAPRHVPGGRLIGAIVAACIGVGSLKKRFQAALNK
jgi:hypothetical protein